MSSPNQYSSEADKAQGYPFAIQLVPDKGDTIDGKEYRESLLVHGVEELHGNVVQCMLLPKGCFLVIWGWGRATTTYSGFQGFPEMPVYTVKEFIAKHNNKKQGGAVCVK